MPTNRPSNVLGLSAPTRRRVVARAVTKPPSPHRFADAETEDVATRLYVRGHIDLTATPGLRTEFEQAILGAGSDVVLDCADMTSMDSSAILQLVELRDSLEASGRRLRVAAVSTDVARAIELLGLTGTLGSEEFLPTEKMPQLEHWSPAKPC
jgi:anti-anti-sigma factor